MTAEPMTAQQRPAVTVPTWTIADRLRKSREHAQLSQQDLADAIGVSRYTISNYELGTRPRPRTLHDWAMACGVPTLWVVTGGDDEPPEDSPEGQIWQKLSLLHSVRF